jgi:SsrA-binding protein
MGDDIRKNVEIKNKKAFFQYEIIDKYEAGIVLKGTEIKSIRQGKASIKEGYCAFKKGELFILNMNISPYSEAGHENHEMTRPRKLLLHQQEINKLIKSKKDVGLTIIPLKLYINKSGFAKLQIALAKGKKMQDKRHKLKEKDLKRQIDRARK